MSDLPYVKMNLHQIQLFHKDRVAEATFKLFKTEFVKRRSATTHTSEKSVIMILYNTPNTYAVLGVFHRNFIRFAKLP